MQDFLFDTPYWFLGGAAAVGIGLFVFGNKRTDSTLRNLGLAVVGVGVLIFLLSWFVDTDKEKCVKRTRALINAVEKRDWATFDSLVSPNCTVRVPVAGAIYNSRDALHRATESAADQFGLKSNRVMGIDVSETTAFISIGVSVLSDGSVGYPLNTSWVMEWQESKSGWQLTDLNAVKIGSESGSQMEHNFPKVH